MIGRWSQIMLRTSDRNQWCSQKRWRFLNAVRARISRFAGHYLGMTKREKCKGAQVAEEVGFEPTIRFHA